MLCSPHNPATTIVPRAPLLALLSALGDDPPLLVLDEAYGDFVDDPEYPDAISEYAKAGRRVLVLRTFSKIYGLAALRVGYGIGSEDVITSITKVRRAFDVTSVAQEAALASLDDTEEIARRRRANRESMALLVAALRAAGLDPVEPAVANFLFVEVDDAASLNDALLRRGVIVRPLGSFGAANALRITAGTPDEIAFLADALQAVVPALRQGA